jgi:hypothetical protein
LLIDRFVEHRKAAANGQEERVTTLEAEIGSLLREKEETLTGKSLIPHPPGA